MSVRVSLDGVSTDGELAMPERARGLVLFAHGSGSGRHSPRNRRVAERLQADGLATLLIDLLTEEEAAIDARTRELRFDIGLLAERLVAASDWLDGVPGARSLGRGYFGASTGAAAALLAATHRADRIRALVSRGGRPDLAADALPRVRAPTLLIVGGADEQVIRLNEQASAQLNVRHRLEIVEGATHLFEEPGALDRVAELAADWFVRYLAPGAS